MQDIVTAPLTVGEVARVTGYQEATVRGWLQRGLLPFVQVGRSGWRRVHVDVLAQFGARHGIHLHWDQLP